MTYVPKDAREITDLAAQEQAASSPMRRRQREVRDLYGGDLAVPLTEMYEDERAATANLLQQGLDGTAQRIASTESHVDWHALRPGFKEHEERARQQRQVSLGWREANAMDLIRLRRARHIIGYSESPVQIRWDRKRMIPCWNVRDPLGTYCAPMARLDDMVPAWTLSCYTRSLGWVKKFYPDAWFVLSVGEHRGDGVLVDIVEYEDEFEVVLVAVGKHETGMWTPPSLGLSSRSVVVLERAPNLADRPTTVVPGRIGLTEERRGQFDGMIPKYIRQARLEALELIAVEQGIFPKTWAISRPGEQVQIITHANPRAGVMGKIAGGELFVQNLNPGYKTREMRADLERSQRIEGRLSASMTSEAPSGARTARMAESVEGGGVDFGVAEIQKILARSEQAELEIAAVLARKVAGRVSVSMYVSAKGAKGPVTYEADKLFAEGCSVSVTYPMAGTDINQQVQRVGMKLQLGLISEQMAREQDPEVSDAELAKDQITAEGLEKAVLTGFQQLAAGAAENPGALEQVLRVAELVRTDKKELIEAGIQAAKEAREAQASVAPAPPDGMTMDPSMAPGLGTASAPLEPAAPAPPDSAGMAQRLAAAVAGAGQGEAA